MIAAVAALILATGIGGPGDSTQVAPGTGPRIEASRIGVGAAEPDTIRPRRHALRLSEAYNTRLELHKIGAYAMLPMFAFEYAAGQQLMQKSAQAPAWARIGHRVVATGMLVTFTMNTYTGGMNWWETRSQESGFAWRTAHSVLMLLSDAGFSLAGQLSTPAQNDINIRRLHKQVAISSMAIATTGYLMMLKPFRRD